MKTKIFSLIVILAICALLLGCAEKPIAPEDNTPIDNGDTEPIVTKPTEPSSTFADASNRFGFDLYSKYSGNKGNIFFSPFSISSALAITYEGAKGQTAEEIKSVFHYPETEAMRSSFRTIYDTINKEEKSYNLSTANALWAQKGYKFLPEYLSLADKQYGAKTENLDFIVENAQSIAAINAWVSQQTTGRIGDIIKQLDPFTRLVITNAVYFEGEWSDWFSEDLTEDKEFRVTPEEKIKVPMMALLGKRVNYAENSKLQAIRLPYKGNELSMIVLLPKNDDIAGMEKGLDADSVKGIEESMEYLKVNVHMPKFKFETEYGMANTLKAMGMPTAFSLAADFSGMTGGKDLFIGDVIHKAFVEVNEKGTEAAAATAVVMATTSAPMPEEPEIPKEFNADHAFIFLIEERQTGAILFMGRVSNPAA